MLRASDRKAGDKSVRPPDFWTKRTHSRAKQTKTKQEKGKMKSSRSASSQVVPARKTSKKAAASAVAEIPAKPQRKKVIQDSREQVALRAYFIGERRRSLGIVGDETSDWVQAEQELSQESKE
jgi:hypothetical protein